MLGFVIPADVRRNFSTRVSMRSWRKPDRGHGRRAQSSPDGTGTTLRRRRRSDGYDPQMLATLFADEDLAEVAAALGSRPIAARAVGWGDARATFHVVLADGRAFAVRRVPREDASQALRIASAMTLMADGGLPTARAVLTCTAGATWLSVPWVDGATGAAWLDEPSRACRLADSMGRLVRLIGRIDPADPSAPNPPFRDGIRAEALAGWLATVALEPAVRRAVATAIDGCRALDQRPSIVVHGDYAPINVIVDSEGDIRALIDLEHAGLGRPHADVAWWGWVVRHHHPDAWAVAWPIFRSAAGVDPGVSSADLHALALVGLAERAATARLAADQRRWLARLGEAAMWSVPLDDQAT
jgi:aminoglycoside phosphotransferase (APT) family kinase protein